MAKTKSTDSPARTSAKGATKKAVGIAIDQLSEEVLNKLQALNVEHALQADLQWCIGSYRHDKNPIGLYQMLERALPVLQAKRQQNARAVPARLITSIEKALKQKV
jgi:hypothetical protein